MSAFPRGSAGSVDGMHAVSLCQYCAGTLPCSSTAIVKKRAADLVQSTAKIACISSTTSSNAQLAGPQVQAFTAPAHRRSLLSFSTLSAQELVAQHKACVAATKKGPYTYTRTRCGCAALSRLLNSRDIDPPPSGRWQHPPCPHPVAEQSPYVPCLCPQPDPAAAAARSGVQLSSDT